jgi:transposase
MEATGVYWKPVWNILSDGKFELIVANAKHIKNVPGRKTDMNDAMWFADLVSVGLIKASFVPEPEMQELRSLLRARKQLTREQTRHVQRIQKTLEEANIKLDSVITDIMGLSGRRMIEAMLNGITNPWKLADLAHGRIKASRKELYDALHGRLTDHHRFMLRLHLRQYDALVEAIAEIDKVVDAAIAKMDAEVAAGQATFRSLIALLCTIQVSVTWRQGSSSPKSAPTWAVSRPLVICCPGLACVRGRTKVPANGSRRVCAKVPPG